MPVYLSRRRYLVFGKVRERTAASRGSDTAAAAELSRISFRARRDSERKETVATCPGQPRELGVGLMAELMSCGNPEMECTVWENVDSWTSSSEEIRRSKVENADGYCKFLALGVPSRTWSI